MFNEQVINRSCAFSEPAVAQLVRRVADDDIEFHVEDFLRLVGVNKGVGVALQFVAPLVIPLIGPAVHATAILPGMFHALKMDVTFRAVERFAGGILPVGGFRAIHRAA